MRWMNLEPIIQSELSQKGKDKYCILTHIYGMQKNDTEQFILFAINNLFKTTSLQMEKQT